MKPKWHFILTSTYISIFWGNFCLFLLDYKLLSSIFSLLFGFFCEFQCLLQKNTFILGIFYFILAWKGLKAIKSKCIYFSLPTSHKSAIKSNPLMQLDSIFYKTVNKNKLRVWKFQSHRFSSFLAIKETVTGVEVEWGDLFYYHYFPLYSKEQENINCLPSIIQN